MRKAFSYLRFSHERQRFGESIKRQTERFNQFCKRHKLTPDLGLQLRDDAKSAFKGEHIKAGKLVHFCEPQKGEKSLAVLCWWLKTLTA